MRVTSLPVSSPKSSSPIERRNAAEALAPQEHGHRAERQVQVLGVRNQRQERQQREGVQPPVRFARDAGPFEPQTRPGR